MANRPPVDTPFEEMPLFMDALPADPSGNVALEMLMALLAEGTPDERAANLRTHGNDAYALGGPRHTADAVHFYTRALEQGSSDAVLIATIHINRAAAHLVLQNYADAQRDAERFLEVAPAAGVAHSVWIKAHCRRARAALHTGDLDAAAEALGALRALLGVPDGAEAPPVLADLLKEYAAADAPLAPIRDAVARCAPGGGSKSARVPRVVAGAEDEVLSAFSADARADLLRSIGTARICGPEVLFPLVLFYPADAQTDVLGSVAASATVGDVLAHVLRTPPAWDDARKYASPGALRAFFVSRVPPGVRRARPFEGARLVALRHAATLADLVASGHVVAVERGILGLHVVPEADVSAFVHRFGSIHATV